jgi:hypothetical protein
MVMQHKKKKTTTKKLVPSENMPCVCHCCTKRRTALLTLQALTGVVERALEKVAALHAPYAPLRLDSGVRTGQRQSTTSRLLLWTSPVPCAFLKEPSMNLTLQQIEQEFRRQVHLCEGIGKERMLQIVNEHRFLFDIFQRMEKVSDDDTLDRQTRGA